ncbi:MAG: 4Fe-4S binding protein [Patescibacteria group bacterium]|nr:4Fe-4S binding protein [Patescibacteria group bacterium]
MKFEINKSKCVGCGVCLDACPYGVIKIGEDGKAFIDQNKCKKCGKCREACSFGAIEEISEDSKLTQNSSDFSVGKRQGFGSGAGKGMGKGFGRGLGNGPRDGRGGGRGRRRMS